jgi:hypothetical protein
LASVAGKTLADFPELVAQIDREKHPDINPEKIAAAGRQKINWICPEGPDHKWPQRMDIRTRGVSCPCCAGKKVSVTNSLATLYPEIAKEWDYTKNDKTPEEVVAGSHIRAFWKCSKGSDHEWPQQIGVRTGMGVGCPHCAGKKASIDYNLEVLHPDIAEYWYQTKNGKTTPDKVVPGSNHKYWWKCDKGPDHEWEAGPNELTTRKRRWGKITCPYCNGKRVSVTNRLDLNFPEIAKELHPTKNGSWTADTLVSGSYRKMYWQCSRNPEHVWPTTPGERTAAGSGCPDCNIWGTSRTEIEIAYEIKNFFDINMTAQTIKAKGKTWKPDIIIDEHKLIIEYDGSYHHRVSRIQSGIPKLDRDKEKNAALKSLGYRVIRIREEPLPATSEDDVVVPKNNSFRNRGMFVKFCVNKALQQIEKVCDINIPGLSKYLKLDSTVNKQAADEHFATLLRN